MVNVETDVTVGPFLRRLADNAGVVYTLVDGDQPGVTMNMVEWAKTLGFEIVAAGRGTVFYDDDRVGIPDTVPQRFGFSEELIERRTINFKMFNSFRDGSKAQIEMTSLANMAGLPPDVRGMHEPSVDIADIAEVFSLKEEGGILSRHGVVELANSIATDGKTMLEIHFGWGYSSLFGRIIHSPKKTSPVTTCIRAVMVRTTFSTVRITSWLLKHRFRLRKPSFTDNRQARHSGHLSLTLSPLLNAT